jgi:hypothetical protein
LANYSPAICKIDLLHWHQGILPKNILFVLFGPGTKKPPSATEGVEYAEAVSAVLGQRKSERGHAKAKEYCYSADKQRNLWIINGAPYTSEDGLSKEDAAALTSEAENRKKRKPEKAYALLDMSRSRANPSARKPIPQEIKLSAWRRDQGRCIECGNNANLEFDPIKPVSMGGANTERNLRLLCIDCNRRKGASL